MLQDNPSGTPPQQVEGSASSTSAEEQARKEAIDQIERKRHFWSRAVFWTLGLLVLAAIWAVSEYNNAGGWPTNGFSESSGQPHVWNLWIIYPAIAWAFLTTAAGLAVYRRRPISEQDIERELKHRTH